MNPLLGQSGIGLLQLRGHGSKIFPRIQSEYCLQNIPPMFVTVFYKQARNGHSKNGNGNGNGKH